MFNTFSHPTCRHWAIFYGAAAALLAGWLFFEKMPDGREELAGSVEGTFWRSGEVVEKSNEELLWAIQDEAEDYPSPQAEDYTKRAEKVLDLAAKFKSQHEEDGAAQRFCSLRDSFLMLADNDFVPQAIAKGLGNVDLTNQWLKKYKSLKTSLLLVQSEVLTSSVLNYSATKIFGISEIFAYWQPCFLPSTFVPQTGEAFQAETFLAAFGTPSERKCADFTCFLNDQPLPLRDGVATIRTTFPTPGPHTLRLRFRRERCRDGSVTEVSRDFKVNVLERCE